MNHDDFDNFDEDLPDDPVAPTYPTAQWCNNRMAAFKQKGGVFMPTKQMPNGLQLPGWMATEAEFDEGTDTGLGALSLDIALIRTRFRWKMGQKKFASRRAVSPTAGSGIRGNLHLLCVAKGGNMPIAITFTGVPSQEIERGLQSFYNSVVAEANKTSQRRLPRYAFWLPLAVGQPYKAGGVEGKQKAIMPPLVSLPEEMTRDYLKSRYVGDDNLRQFAEWYRAAEAWATRWDTLYITAPHEQPTAPVYSEEPQL